MGDTNNFIGYSIDISPAPPPPLTTPILVGRAPMSVTYIVMGLANFTSYSFTVATYNQDGLGPRTQTTTIQTPEAGQ